MKHGPVERASGAFPIFSLVFFAALNPAWSATPAAPVVHTAPQTALPVNDILRGEWTVALGSGADGKPYEPLIPYAATVSAAYAANLSHDENPVNGVTVNAVLTDPAGVLHTYPCWYGEDMTPSATPGHDSDPPQPAGFTGWHLAFPCKAAGAWSGHLTVTDAGGTVSGPTFSFTVAGQLSLPDAAKGRLSPSTTDTRYFQYADGDAYLPMGETFNGGAGGSGYGRLAAIAPTHARALLRTWQSLSAGTFALTGGNSNSGAGTNDGTVGMTAEAAHSGRYSYKVTSQGGNIAGSGGFTYYKPLGQTEAYSVWVKNPTTGTLYAGITSYANYAPTSALTAVPADGAWHHVTGTIGDATPSGVVNPQARFEVDTAPGVLNTTSQYCLFDDCTIVPSGQTLVDAPGSAWDLLGGRGAFEVQNTLQQPGAAGLDTFLQHCRQDDVNLLIEYFDKGDKVQGNIQPDGTNVGNDVNLFGGGAANMMGGYSAAPTGASDAGLETAVGLMHAQQARAWVARFGAYVGQGVAAVAFANETDPGGNIDEWGPELWANQLRLVAPADCLPACGIDTYFPGTVCHWFPNLYESPLLQFAEPHIAVTTAASPNSSYDVPFNSTPNDWLQPGVTRSATGGPFGMGYVEYDRGASSNPALPGIQLPTFRAAGAYTVSCYVETLPDSTGAAFSAAYSTNPFPSTRNTGLYFPYPSQSSYTPTVSVPAAGCPTWQLVTGSFTLGASDVPWQCPQMDFFNNQAHGNVRYADITITAPDGRVLWQAKFDEPLLDQGAGDAVSVWGEPYGTTYSGDPAAVRPVIIGESEAYSPAGVGMITTTGPNGTAATNSVAYPTAQFMLRQAAALVDARACLDTNWYDDSAVMDALGVGADFHTVQSLTDGLALANGTWREVATAQSGYTGAEPFVVYGQANSRNAATGGTQDATQAILSVLPLQPDPATPHAYLPGTGLVDVQGLADAPYTVQEYDMASGHLVATLTATSAGHHLPLNFNAVATGFVVKVSPVSAPALSVQLTVDHATARPGDIVTYTLKYTNTGRGPALGVTIPWAIPAQMQFLSASGGTYDSVRNVVSWSLGTLAPGASGTVVLKEKVK